MVPTMCYGRLEPTWSRGSCGGATHEIRSDHPRPVSAGRRHAASPARGPRGGEARRRAGLRSGREGFALQLASVPVHPADSLSLPGRAGRAEAAAGAGRGAAAAAQPAARGRGAGLARRDERRQAGVRRRHRLPRGGVPRVRHHAEAGRPPLRGMPDGGEAAMDRGLRHHAGVVLRAGERELHRAAGAEADAAGVDRRQHRCRHPTRGAHGGCVVRQSAQQAGDDRATDGGVQARARRMRQAVPRRVPDGARGVHRALARRGDRARAAVARSEVQGVSRRGVRTR